MVGERRRSRGSQGEHTVKQEEVLPKSVVVQETREERLSKEWMVRRVMDYLG